MSVTVRKTDAGTILVKRCPKCNAELPIAAFGSDRSRFDLLAPYCKVHMNSKWLARYRTKDSDGRSIYSYYELKGAN